VIQRVVLRRFKKFAEVTFDVPGHIILAGPNNTGKTTLLQAIAAWDVGFNRWKELGDWKKHGGGFTKAPFSRLAFSAVPLRSFDHLFFERDYSGAIEIEVQSSAGWTAAMEFHAESTEQVYVRPRNDVTPDVLRQIDLKAVFVPPMTGLGTAEPVYTSPKIEQLLGQGKPGDVLRNLLVAAHASETAWPALKEATQRLFGYEILPPNSQGADILSEYRTRVDGPRLDIASAGSGFQQVLMLLTFLHTRPASVLLLDEPDAHLHVILQDVIYSELRSVAAKQGSQLVIATHSEVIINSADPSELCMLLNVPRIVGDTAERQRLIKSLGILSNTDIMEALEAPGVLYVEDYTDIAILREFARVLGHPAYETLTKALFWKKTVSEPRTGAAGIRSRDHYEALQLVRPGLPGLELVDGDAHSAVQSTPISGAGLQRLRWRRYEVESYLLHPNAIARFIRGKVGTPLFASAHEADLHKHFEDNYPGAFLKDPFGDAPYLVGTKARTLLLPPALSAGGLPAFPYTRYHEIAAGMKPAEVHPEVTEKLDAIQKAFGR
jgi:predicted ATPase